MTYAKLLLFFGVIPIVILWVLRWKLIRRYAASLFTIVVLVLMVSIPWEAASVNRIWYYSERIIWGPAFLGIPVEEVAFYVIDALLIGTSALLLGERKIDTR